MLRRTGLLALLIGCRDVPTLADAPGAPSDTPDVPGDARPPDAPIDELDGAPVRRPCVATFGADLTASSFGRMDGILVAIVPPGGPKACHADSDHLHLQIQVNAKIYDVAVNVGIDVHSTTLDRAAFSPWSEGWHTDAGVFVDYTGLGLHAATIPLSTPTALINAMTSDFETVNHISIYATSYTTSDGAHLVHYNGGGRDGMIVTKPLSPTAHMRAFSFDASSF